MLAIARVRPSATTESEKIGYRRCSEADAGLMLVRCESARELVQTYGYGEQSDDHDPHHYPDCAIDCHPSYMALQCGVGILSGRSDWCDSSDPHNYVTLRPHLSALSTVHKRSSRKLAVRLMTLILESLLHNSPDIHCSKRLAKIGHVHFFQKQSGLRAQCVAGEKNHALEEVRSALL